MSLYFDLDGVLREFGTYILGYEPFCWDAKRNGKTVIEIVNEHPEICLSCPETEYLKVVNDMLDHITILTNQKTSWISFTNKWLNNHIKIGYDVIYTSNAEEKLSMIDKDSILVEDYPLFDNYSNIALITMNYNKHLKVPIRISNIKEFINFIIKYNYK